jgi:hypothetical protein
MVASVTAVLKRLKTEWTTQWHSEAIIAACEEAGDTSWRARVLTPVTPIPRCLCQMWHGHTAGRPGPPLAGRRCRAAADWQARPPRPLDLVALLWTRLGTAGPPHVAEDGGWHGPRPWLVEGAGGSRPATPACQPACGPPPVPRPGGGVPVVRRLGVFHAGPGLLLTRVGAPLLSPARALVRAVPPRVPAGDVLGAARGLGASAPLALLAQAGVPAGRRLGARPRVDCTPGRPVVRPGGRRPPAGHGLRRSRGLTARGVRAPRVTGVNPTPPPSWRPRQPRAALPAALGRREGREPSGAPGGRTRASPLVTTRREAEADRGRARAERSRRRWQVEPSRAQRNTGRQLEGRPGHTVAGPLQAWTVVAMVDHLVRLVMRPAPTRPHTAAARLSGLEARRWRGAPRPGRPFMGVLVTPRRAHRLEPRVKKRRPTPCSLLITPRQERRQPRLQHEL